MMLVDEGKVSLDDPVEKFLPEFKEQQVAEAGINTGGRIIEVVSGMPYAEFMQSRLFDPLGMKDTTFWPDDEQARRLAHSARPNEDGAASTCPAMSRR